MSKIVGNTTATPPPLQEFSNVLKGYSSGGVISDISPIEHKIICKVKSKNKIPNSVLDLANWTNTKTSEYYSPIIELETGKTYCLSGYSNRTSSFGYFYLMEASDDFATENAIIQLFKGNAYNNGNTFVAKEGHQYRFYYYGSNTVFADIYNLMIGEGTSITDYAPCLEDLTQAGVRFSNNDTYEDGKSVYADSSGNIEGIVSHFPSMSFRGVYNNSDVVGGCVLEITYNRDVNKAFEEIKNAIISLGGNV